MANQETQLSIFHLPREVLALILHHVRNPADWGALMETNRACKTIVQQFCFPRITTIHIAASPKINSQIDNKPGALWIEATVFGPGIEPPTPKIRRDPRTRYRFYSVFRTSKIHPSDQLERFITTTLPYLWYHTRTDIEIHIHSDEEESPPILSAMDNSPLIATLATLAKLQEQLPKKITGFHLETAIIIPHKWIAHFLTTWNATLNKVSLFTEGYHLDQWIPLLQDCRLTHLGINLGPHLETPTRGIDNEAPIPFHKLEPVITNPHSRISHLKFRFCEFRDHKHQTHSSTVQLANLLANMHPSEVIHLSLPPQFLPPNHYVIGYEEQNNWLSNALSSFPPLQNNLELTPPSMQLGLKKLVIEDRSLFTMKLDIQFFNTFPLLTEIEGVAMTPGLINQITSMVRYYMSQEHPFSLVITCPSIYYAECRYRQILTAAVECTPNVIGGGITIKTPEAFSSNEELSIHFKDRKQTINVFLKAAVEMTRIPPRIG
jgi:hypothetical protein